MESPTAEVDESLGRTDKSSEPQGDARTTSTQDRSNPRGGAASPELLGDLVSKNERKGLTFLACVLSNDQGGLHALRGCS